MFWSSVRLKKLGTPNVAAHDVQGILEMKEYYRYLRSYDDMFSKALCSKTPFFDVVPLPSAVFIPSKAITRAMPCPCHGINSNTPNAPSTTYCHTIEIIILFYMGGSIHGETPPGCWMIFMKMPIYKPWMRTVRVPPWRNGNPPSHPLKNGILPTKHHLFSGIPHDYGKHRFLGACWIPPCFTLFHVVSPCLSFTGPASWQKRDSKSVTAWRRDLSLSTLLRNEWPVANVCEDLVAQKQHYIICFNFLRMVKFAKGIAIRVAQRSQLKCRSCPDFLSWCDWSMQ